MKTLGSLLIACAAILSPVSGHAATPCINDEYIAVTNGACWQSLTDIEKKRAVVGIWTGIDVMRAALALGGRNPNMRDQKNFASIPDHTTAPDVVRYMDDLYALPANRAIEWQGAYMLAALRASDDDSNDHETLVRFLRDYARVPAFASWDGNIDGNLIRLRTRDGDLTVQLAGVHAPRPADRNPEMQARILNLMEVIKSADWRTSCDGETPDEVRVRLSFPYELFSDDGHLVAEVEVGGDNVCVRGEMIPTSTLWGRGSFFDIGGLLLAKGLVLPDEKVDPKWSKTRRLAMKTVTDRADAAKQGHLYLHGNKQDAMIELISGMGVSTSF